MREPIMSDEIVINHVDSVERELSSRTGQKLNDVFCKSFKSLFKDRKNIYHLFFSLIKKLGKFFSISKAILVVRSPEDNALKVIALKSRHHARQGLALTLPKRDSLLHRVFKNRQVYSASYPGDFEGNFIEKKLLLEDDTGSVAICPVSVNGTMQGLLCLTSPVVYAFSMFEEGFLDGVLEKFGRSIAREMKRLYV